MFDYMAHNSVPNAIVVAIIVKISSPEREQGTNKTTEVKLSICRTIGKYIMWFRLSVLSH